jgi:hypothetical protein
VSQVKKSKRIKVTPTLGLFLVAKLAIALPLEDIYPKAFSLANSNFSQKLTNPVNFEPHGKEPTHANDGETAAVYVPAETAANRLRDKMPYFRKDPKLVGNSLIFTVDVSPMREKGQKGTALLDQIGGYVQIARAGNNLLKPPFTSGDAPGALLFDSVLPIRAVTKAGAHFFRVRLPNEVAISLRKGPQTHLAQRVRVHVWNDKDTNAAVAGHDRRQVTSAWMFKGYRTYLESRRKVNNSRAFALKAPPSSPPGTVVIYNGSPFDLNIAINPVQCMIPAYMTGGGSTNPPTVPSNTSYEFFQATEIASNYFYDDNSEWLGDDATAGMKSLEGEAFVSLERAAFLKHITQSFSRGLIYFGSSMAFNITLGMVETLIAESNACTDAGSAYNVSWTNANVGATQTAGNVNYWVPSYNRTVGIGFPQVMPTSIPDVAPGSPLNAYNATSQNGLAVDAATLQSELGLGGTVTLATLNSNQRVSSSYDGYWCNFRNQQIANPGSSSSAQFGASALGGGTSPDWGPCNATTVTGSYDYIADYYGVSKSSQAENTGMSILIGYSSTSSVTAGPSPALPPQSAPSASECIASAAPCIYTVAPTVKSPNLTVGCTPGDWNMLTPWNGSNMSLSSPPSAYQSSSTLSTQIAFTGFMANGTPVTDSIPIADGGNVSSSFAPNVVNPFTFTPANLQSIQSALGGPGGYVTNWLCVMTANTLVPSGVSSFAPSAVAMNLGWYGKPVVAYAPNPAGNLLSPPGAN